MLKSLDDREIVFYRHHPWGSPVAWVAVSLCAFSGAIFYEATGQLTVAVLVALGGCGLAACVMPTRTVLANDSEIIVRRTTLARLFPRVERYAASEIRRVRYRTENFRNGNADNGGPDIHYVVDLVLLDGTIVPLIRSKIFPLKPGVGKRLAAQVGATYAEFLDEP